MRAFELELLAEELCPLVEIEWNTEKSEYDFKTLTIRIEACDDEALLTCLFLHELGHALQHLEDFNYFTNNTEWNFEEDAWIRAEVLIDNFGICRDFFESVKTECLESYWGYVGVISAIDLEEEAAEQVTNLLYLL